jgi:uncharacterized ferritin-like protein (DUF455 family)
METVFTRAHRCLMERDLESKLRRVRKLGAHWRGGRLGVFRITLAAEPVVEPGRPPRPLLVSPREVARRQVSTPEGRAVLLHALAHIEFNAVNLALDAVYRFRDMPREFYDDWIRVAVEEAHHFALLRDHLRLLGYDYGHFAAHNGLWEMAVKTAHDPLVRMALVPRVLEARGLDASPTLVAKLRSCGDARAVEIMELIQHDEIGHVAIGSRWYRYLCAQRGLEPVATFRQLLREYDGPRLRAPFDHAARRRAGFSEQELELIEELAAGR